MTDGVHLHEAAIDRGAQWTVDAGWSMMRRISTLPAGALILSMAGVGLFALPASGATIGLRSKGSVLASW